MDIFHYFTNKNDSLLDQVDTFGQELETVGPLESDMVQWEVTHYSPFTHYYALHMELETGNKTAMESHSAHDLVKFYIECVAISVVGIPGIVGNILSAIVLLTAKMRSPITYLLLGLTLTDLLMILNCLMGMAVPSYFLYYRIDFLHYQVAAMLPTLFAIGKTAHVASVLYALFITIERFFAVMHPLRARRFCTLTRAKITSVIILVFSIVYNIPRFFEFTYIRVSVYPNIFNQVENSERVNFYYFPLTTSLRKSETYRQVATAIHLSLFYVIPMILIIYLNALIYSELKSARKRRETMTVSQICENNVTTTLLIIVVVFVTCNFLPMVNLVSRIVTGNPEIFVLDSIRNFLWIFNSSVNFVIYYAYSDGFRNTWLDLWSDCFSAVCYSTVRKKRRLKYHSSGNNYSNSSSRISVFTITSSIRSTSVKRHFGVTPEGELDTRPPKAILPC